MIHRVWSVKKQVAMDSLVSESICRILTSAKSPMCFLRQSDSRNVLEPAVQKTPAECGGAVSIQTCPNQRRISILYTV